MLSATVYRIPTASSIWLVPTFCFILVKQTQMRGESEPARACGALVAVVILPTLGIFGSGCLSYSLRAPNVMSGRDDDVFVYLVCCVAIVGAFGFDCAGDDGMRTYLLHRLSRVELLCVELYCTTLHCASLHR